MKNPYATVADRIYRRHQLRVLAAEGITPKQVEARIKANAGWSYPEALGNPSQRTIDQLIKQRETL